MPKKPSAQDYALLQEATDNKKVLFEHDGITKGDIIAYYQAIAPYMLPYLKDRPLTMQRYPDGIHGKWWFQKDIPSYFPDWIARFPTTTSTGGTTTYVLCQNTETLMYLANQACITSHIWLSRYDKPMYPDRLIFDLDPGEHTTFALIQKTALLLKEMLEAAGLKPFAMTTGSRGIHVVTPIQRTVPFSVAHDFTRAIANSAALLHPDELTTDIRKEKRHGKLFIDFYRNSYGHTGVAPYSIRPIDGAPVATPLMWKEVNDPHLTSQTYTIINLFKRIQKLGNVWKEFEESKATLPKKIRDS